MTDFYRAKTISTVTCKKTLITYPCIFFFPGQTLRKESSLFPRDERWKVKIGNVMKGREIWVNFLLDFTENDETLSKWRWLTVKQVGAKPCPRSGISAVAVPGIWFSFGKA